jgi:hypothetical protein
MPTSNRPTLATLRDLIKIESRVKGADNLDGYIDALVNELLLDYAQKNRYFEFLITNSPITTLAATGSYTLPTNFMSMRMVRYRDVNSGAVRTLNIRPQYIDTALGSLPRWYELAGDKLVIFPVDDLQAGNTLLLDYYKVPDTLTANDPFPIPRLLPTVKLEAISRVLIYNEQMASAAALKGEAVDNETRSKPANA